MAAQRVAVAAAVFFTVILPLFFVSSHDDGSIPTTTAFTAPLSVSAAPPVSSTTAPPAPSTTTSTTTPPTTLAPRPPDYHTLPDWSLWSHIGRCEQGGHGADGINWTHRGAYNGGLGILNVNWLAAARALGLPMNAADATPYQQILGARYHRLHHGLNGWGCWRLHHHQWGL